MEQLTTGLFYLLNDITMNTNELHNLECMKLFATILNSFIVASNGQLSVDEMTDTVTANMQPI